MIKRVVGFALHQPLFVVLMVVLFIGGGVAAFHNSADRGVSRRLGHPGERHHLYPGRAPEEVEKQVTMPIETVLNGLPHVVRMFSHTQFGLSFIMLTFDDNTTDYCRPGSKRSNAWPRRTCRQGVQPQLAPLSTAIGEIFRYRVKGDGYTSRELRTLEDWVVERNLRVRAGRGRRRHALAAWSRRMRSIPTWRGCATTALRLQQLYTALGPRQRQRRRQQSDAGFAAVSHPRRRHAALRRRNQKHRHRRA